MSSTAVASTSFATFLVRSAIVGAVGVPAVTLDKRLRDALRSAMDPAMRQDPVSADSEKFGFLQATREYEKEFLKKWQGEEKGIARAMALAKAMENAPVLKCLSEADQDESSASSSALLARLSSPSVRLEDRIAMAESASNEILNKAASALKRIGDLQQEIVLGEAGAALEELGYAIKTRTGAELRAIQGEHVVAVQVAIGGRLAVDLGGFDGVSCKAALGEFFVALERRGVRVKLEQKVFHGRKEGGVLLRGVQAGAVKHPIKAMDQKRQASDLGSAGKTASTDQPIREKQRMNASLRARSRQRGKVR